MPSEPLGPADQYRSRVATGAIAFDPDQQRASEALDRLHRELSDRNDARRARKSLLGSRENGVAPKGLYLHGGVGRGKSMLMNMFFASAPVGAKRRVHFHAFMLEIHAFIARWRKLSAEERRRDTAFVRGAADDPIPPTAEHVAQGAQLLCFDEFQVEDIADAMILGRLFKELFERSVVVVATSNRAPDDLYTNGINRQLFLPFIALLKEKLTILELGPGADYRLNRLKGSPVYHVGIGPAVDAAMDRAFAQLTDDAAGEPKALDVQGRSFTIPRQSHGVARLTFDDLCRSARGAADYLELARAFHVVMIDHIPVLSAEERNEAKRFVTLIDALYEHKVKLVASSAAAPGKLYVAGDGAASFERTASRLIEMQSADYVAARHIA